MPQIPVTNARIFTQTLGSGPPVLLIAGMASDVASWTPLVPLLRSQFQLISFDNRGTGRTQLQSNTFSIDDMVADALAVLDYHKIKKAHIVGHSLGGIIGLRMSKRYPGRVGSFVSLAAANVPSAESIVYFKEMAQLYKSDMAKEDWFKLLLPALFSPGFFASEEALNATAASAAAYPHCQSPDNLHHQVQMFKTIEPVELEDINIPVLSVAGELDIAFPPAVVRQELGNLPDATFKTLANIAHSIHWEAPQKIASEIKIYLDAHPI